MPTTKQAQAMAAVDAAWDHYQDVRESLDAKSSFFDGREGLAYYQSAHPVWTPEMAAVLPTEAEAGSDDDPVCYYRLVAPHNGRCEWYVMAANDRDGDTILFVYANLDDPENAEVGFVSLNELRAIRGPSLLNVETERFYQPERLSAVRQRVEHGWGTSAVAPAPLLSLIKGESSSSTVGRFGMGAKGGAKGGS